MRKIKITDITLKKLSGEREISLLFREKTAIAACADSLGADAIVNVRYASSAIMQGAAEVIAYGTAVRFVK